MIGDSMRKSTRHISCAKKCCQASCYGMISLNW